MESFKGLTTYFIVDRVTRSVLLKWCVLRYRFLFVGDLSLGFSFYMKGHDLFRAVRRAYFAVSHRHDGLIELGSRVSLIYGLTLSRACA